MKSYSLKPFGDNKNYLSEKDALKLIEKIPIPGNPSSGNANPAEAKPDNHGTENLGLVGKIIQLDDFPADDGNIKTQDEWFEYWEHINDGRIFASMPDYYQAFKQLRRKFEHGSTQEKQIAQKIIDGLRDDFDLLTERYWLVSSTRIRYQPDKEDAQIIHHYNCNNKSAIQQYNLLIPEYLEVLIANVLNNVNGLTYMQTLFETKDDKEAIMQNLEFISNKNRNEIRIGNPPILEGTSYITRKKSPERAAIFSYYCNEFRISGGGSTSCDNHSRGVLIKRRKKFRSIR